MEYNKEHMAKTMGRALPISTKYSVEVCSFIRKKKLEQAKKLLKGVVDQKVPLPIKRYKRDIPHKTGVGPGKYLFWGSYQCKVKSTSKFLKRDSL